MDKKFYNQLAVLAVPIIIQQFIQAALNMVDTVMIGRLGSNEIAAVGIANQVFFFVMLIILELTVEYPSLLLNFLVVKIMIILRRPWVSVWYLD